MSRFFRAVRMGNGCQPPALLYVPDAQGSLHQGSTYCAYAIRVPGGVPYVPRTVAPQVAHMQPGKPLMPMRRADRQGEPSGGLAGRRLHILRARPEALGPARLLLFMTTAGPPPSKKLAPALISSLACCFPCLRRSCLPWLFAVPKTLAFWPPFSAFGTGLRHHFGPITSLASLPTSCNQAHPCT